MKTILTLLALTLTLVGCTPHDAPRPRFGVPPDAGISAPLTNAQMDAAHGNPTLPSYDRKLFGTRWPRVHGNCDTREDVLARDAGPDAIDTDGDGCRDDGPLTDLYTGATITPHQAQIDHVLSLGQAWYAGAWAWTPVQRHAFYTDETNLRAVTGAVNDRKGDLGPARWRPPAHTSWCTFSTVYRGTALKYHLNITLADEAALTDMAGTC